MNKYRSIGFKILEISMQGGLILHPMLYLDRSSAKRWINAEMPFRPNSTFRVYRTRNSANGDLALLLEAVDQVKKKPK